MTLGIPGKAALRSTKSAVIAICIVRKKDSASDLQKSYAPTLEHSISLWLNSKAPWFSFVLGATFSFPKPINGALKPGKLFDPPHTLHFKSSQNDRTSSPPGFP